MVALTPKQKRSALLTGALVYSAAMAGLFGWLAFNSEDTLQDRIAHTPSATVSIAEKKAEVPASWTGQAPAMPEAKVLPAEPPVTADVKPPEPKPLDTKPEETKPVEEKPQAEKPAEPAPVAKTETAPASTEPAVTTNPIEQAAPVSAVKAPAWHKFARSFTPSDKPKIALIISDLGFAASATQAAVQDLPGEVTLAFSSQAPDIEGWIAKARAAGHETILTVPMEPNDYPKNDPGPNTLLLSLSNKENTSRINWAMARADGYVGVMPYMGEKFVTSDSKLAPVLDAVKEHDSMVVDGTNNKNSLIASLSRLAHIPFARSDVLIDAAASRNAIDAQLAALETAAKEKGQAVGIALPYPVTLEKLKSWIASLEAKGFVLAPISVFASENAPIPAMVPTASIAPVVAPQPTAPLAAPTETATAPAATPETATATETQAAPASGPIDIPVATGKDASLHRYDPKVGP